MTTIANALTSLGVDEWVLRGEPTTEEEFNNMFRKVIGKDENNSAIESSNPKDFTVTWKQVSDEKKKLADAEPMRLLREKRTFLLKQTDWMANTDVTMPSAWKTYRQALRDITKDAKPKLDSNGALDESSVKFPTKPS